MDRALGARSILRICACRHIVPESNAFHLPTSCNDRENVCSIYLLITFLIRQIQNVIDVFPFFCGPFSCRGGDLWLIECPLRPIHILHKICNDGLGTYLVCVLCQLQIVNILEAVQSLSPPWLGKRSVLD